MSTHVLFVIRSLGRGGAERQLVQLAKALADRGMRVSIATFYDGGPLTAELEDQPGIHLIALGKRGRWDVLPFMARLFRAVRSANPDVLHGFMGVSNELCLLLGRALGIPVVWGIRASYLDLSGADWVPRAAFRMGALLSRFPDLVVFNSEAGRQYHHSKEFRPPRAEVVANGIDTQRFQPDPEARAQVRAAWGIGDDEPLIGIVARIDPMKDLETFIEAAAHLSRDRADVRFVVVGSGDAALREHLKKRAATLGLQDSLRWEPARSDVERVYAALDVSTSTSRGEGFSNTIAEAMACGVPMVVTDVGDSRRIVGATGIVTRAGDPEAVARGWATLLDRQAQEGRQALAQKVRARIEDNFSLDRLGQTMADLLTSLVAQRRRA